MKDYELYAAANEYYKEPLTECPICGDDNWPDEWNEATQEAQDFLEDLYPYCSWPCLVEGAWEEVAERDWERASIEAEMQEIEGGKRAGFWFWTERDNGRPTTSERPQYTAGGTARNMGLRQKERDQSSSREQPKHAGFYFSCACPGLPGRILF